MYFMEKSAVAGGGLVRSSVAFDCPAQTHIEAIPDKPPRTSAVSFFPGSKRPLHRRPRDGLCGGITEGQQHLPGTMWLARAEVQGRPLQGLHPKVSLLTRPLHPIQKRGEIDQFASSVHESDVDEIHGIGWFPAVHECKLSQGLGRRNPASEPRRTGRLGPSRRPGHTMSPRSRLHIVAGDEFLVAKVKPAIANHGMSPDPALGGALR